MFNKGDRVKVVSYPDGDDLNPLGYVGTVLVVDDTPFIEVALDELPNPTEDEGWLFLAEELEKV
jgi:hypothetical protein